MENKSFLKRLKKNKRGMGVGDIYPIMLTIGLVAILIAIVLYVLASFGTQVSTIGAEVLNESGGYLNSSTGIYAVADANSSTCGWNSFVVKEVINVSIPTVPNVLSTTLYTVGASGTITNATSVNVVSANVSYSYKYGGLPCQAINTMNQQIYNFVPWIGIILLVIAAAIVLGVLIRNLGGGQDRV